MHAQVKFFPKGAVKQCPTVSVMPKRNQNGAQVKRIHTKVVKNAFSWGFHFSAYNICPDKIF